MASFFQSNLRELQAGLSISQVAGLISGSISLVHVILPLAAAVLVVTVIKNRRHDAATWSAIGYLLQNSFWPVILFADPASGNFKFKKRIRWRVFLLAVVTTTTPILLLPVVGFLTPRGLIEVIELSESTTNAKFVYVEDASYYGQATLQRPTDPIWRLCGRTKLRDCPNSHYFGAIGNGSIVMVNSSIPQETFSPFITNATSSTISSPMTIDYRNWYQSSRPDVDNKSTNSIGLFRSIQTIAQRDGVYLLEGLIVDGHNGGVGIRNHTQPIDLDLGAQWTEDILWIEPETQCTSVNLSFHFNLSPTAFYNAENGYIRDDGGFVDISPTEPTPWWNDHDPHWDEVGPSPDLQDRSQKLAWWNNQFTAQVLNITATANLSVGDVYYSQLKDWGSLASPGSLTVSNADGMYLDDISYNKTRRPFQPYGVRCSGYDDINSTTTEKAFMRCGYLWGVPYSSLDPQSLSPRYDPGSNWTQALYTCASAVKASIKTVTFESNGTVSLDSMKVLSVEPKAYATNNDLPYWAIEKADETFAIEDIYLFWGLTNSTYATSNQSSIEIKRQEEMYLPAAGRQVTYGHIADSFAAGSAFTVAWESAYEFAAAVKGASLDFIPSLSGENDYGLALRWRNLSSTPDGAANILNLIWTDLVASAVVGSQTGFETSSSLGPFTIPADNGSDYTVLGYRSVSPLVRHVRYSDFRLAIPAFIAAGIFSLAFLISLPLLVFRVVKFGVLKHYINQTSVGRAVTQVSVPVEELAVPGMGTTAWLNGPGKQILDIPHYGDSGKAEGTDGRDEDTEEEEREGDPALIRVPEGEFELLRRHRH